MTDPTGLCFLSYKRDRATDARLVLQALVDRGIPTWQDVFDLPRGVTESELEQVLEDDNVASAVMLVTPDVENSNVIRDVEAPLILKRHARRDGFYAMPIAAGGLDYADIARVVGPRVGLMDLSGFNIYREKSDPVNDNGAAEIARIVLEERVSAIHKRTAAGEALRLQISTRRPLPKESGFALRLDLRHRFDGRLALPGAWESFIIPALQDVVQALQKRAPGRAVQVSGYPSLPAAVATGVAFLSINGLQTTWTQEQEGFGRGAETWGLVVPPIDCGFISVDQPQSAAGTDYALLVSVTNDVTDDFNLSKAGLPLRAAIHIEPGGQRQGRVQLGAGEASHIARLTVDALRRAWTKYGKRGTVHLFLAVPAGLAFMIGQQLNTFGDVLTYEHVPGDATPYKPAVRLQPSR